MNAAEGDSPIPPDARCPGGSQPQCPAMRPGPGDVSRYVAWGGRRHTCPIAPGFRCRLPRPCPVCASQRQPAPASAPVAPQGGWAWAAAWLSTTTTRPCTWPRQFCCQCTLDWGDILRSSFMHSVHVIYSTMLSYMYFMNYSRSFKSIFFNNRACQIVSNQLVGTSAQWQDRACTL